MDIRIFVLVSLPKIFLLKVLLAKLLFHDAESTICVFLDECAAVNIPKIKCRMLGWLFWNR
jgi:hypothetical protein